MDTRISESDSSRFSIPDIFEKHRGLTSSYIIVTEFRDTLYISDTSEMSYSTDFEYCITEISGDAHDTIYFDDVFVGIDKQSR